MTPALVGLALTIGFICGLAIQTERIKRQHQRKAAFLRHLNELKRMSQP